MVNLIYYIVKNLGKDNSDEKTRRLLGLHGQENARGQI
jgi:hypothetical protein